ncbi:hypothetical protein CEXT_432601 [Caerostris extrusa]|uniref:Uncharacterized protein n=1 Tax=Caerostris extrusa TaxID=172846 RepID=A0AAV4YAG4_CAEEX|nr:hypothetical protein CEXT_432601 [Caerostris extrusa]
MRYPFLFLKLNNFAKETLQQQQHQEEMPSRLQTFTLPQYEFHTSSLTRLEELKKKKKEKGAAMSREMKKHAGGRVLINAFSGKKVSK